MVSNFEEKTYELVETLNNMKYMKGKIILHSILKTTITGFVFLHL
jgi:hypothetical protein